MNSRDSKQDILSSGVRPNPDAKNWDERTALDAHGNKVPLGYMGRKAMRELLREGNWGGSSELLTKSELKLLQSLQFLALDHAIQVASLPSIPSGMELEINETSIRTDNALFCIGYECWDCMERRDRGAGDISEILGEIECLLETMIMNLPRYGVWEIGNPEIPRHGIWQVTRRLSREALSLQGLPHEKPTIVLDEFITVGRWVSKALRPKRHIDDAFEHLSFEEAVCESTLIEGNTLTLDVVNLGLKPDHPWYPKPTPDTLKLLSKCKLIFHGTIRSTKKVVPYTNVLENDSEPPQAVVHNDLFVDQNRSATDATEFDFVASIVNATGHLSEVEWTVQAEGLEIVDETDY